MTDGPRIESLSIGCFRIPTDAPESDGTLEWDHTDMVVVELGAGGARGLGYSYAARAAAQLVADTLAPRLIGLPAFEIAGAWSVMNEALRNVGVPGAGSMAVSAVDSALWDLKAKLL